MAQGAPPPPHGGLPLEAQMNVIQARPAVHEDEEYPAPRGNMAMMKALEKAHNFHVLIVFYLTLSS